MADEEHDQSTVTRRELIKALQIVHRALQYLVAGGAGDPSAGLVETMGALAAMVNELEGRPVLPPSQVE